MGLDYIETQQARDSDGLRMVVAPNVPSPWGEAAKGLFHAKGLAWMPVALQPGDAAQAEWLGTATDKMSAPTAFWHDETPVSDARGIVELAERLAPEPALIPEGQEDACFDLITRIAGPGGLCWQRRLHLIHLALSGDAAGQGFHPKVAAYLAPKYGYDADVGQAAEDAVVAHLHALSDTLGSASYIIGDRLSAADIYLACAMALFAPLPDDLCQMRDALRQTFASKTPQTEAALNPTLLAHRNRIYRDHLLLPLQL